MASSDEHPALRLAQPYKIKLAINKSAVCLAPVAVAEQQKIFSKYNLDVEFVNFGNSTDVLLEAIATGKAADLCAVHIADPDALPCFHPVSHLIHVLGRHDVSDVWVAGQQRLQGGRLLQITNTELLSTARLWQNRLRQ